MFLQRIPYQSVRRRRIRNWLLLLLRLAALALIVAAFARPFLRRQALAAAAASGAREVVILVDRSYSMGYGDRWTRARSPRHARRSLRSGRRDRASLVFFASGAEVALRSTPDRGRLEAALGDGEAGRRRDALRAGAEAGRQHRQRVAAAAARGDPDHRLPAQRLAGGRRRAPARRRGAHAVSGRRRRHGERQRHAGVAAALDLFGAGPRHRHRRRRQPRHHSRSANLEMTLEVDGRPVQTRARRASSPTAPSSVTFAPFTPARGGHAGDGAHCGGRAARSTTLFNFIVSPTAAREGPDRGAAGRGARCEPLPVPRACHSATIPRSTLRSNRSTGLTQDDLQRSAVVILNDVPVTQLAAERLGGFVARGGGLLIAAGERATWPAPGKSPGVADALPATLGQAVDRTPAASARLGALEYGHADLRAVPRRRAAAISPSARFYSYRPRLRSRARDIVARFDDGAPALLERRVGNGRVLLVDVVAGPAVERPAAEIRLSALRPPDGHDPGSLPRPAGVAHGGRRAGPAAPGGRAWRACGFGANGADPFRSARSARRRRTGCPRARRAGLLRGARAGTRRSARR